MPNAIFIDNCAFDKLFEYGIEPEDINCDEFQLYVTGEVLAEIDAIPNTEEKAPKKLWISRVARSDAVVETGYFGFAESPGAYGFGQGFLADITQVDYLNETSEELGAPRKKTGFPKNHTDRLLLSHGIIFSVLTAEDTLGTSALMEKAVARGATVIRIQDFDPAKQTIREFLRGHFTDSSASPT